MATMIKTAKRVIAFTVVMLMIVSTFDALIPTERMGDGSWVGWTIDGTYINDKNASDLASASYGILVR